MPRSRSLTVHAILRHRFLRMPRFCIVVGPIALAFNATDRQVAEAERRIASWRQH